MAIGKALKPLDLLKPLAIINPAAEAAKPAEASSVDTILRGTVDKKLKELGVEDPSKYQNLSDAALEFQKRFNAKSPEQRILEDGIIGSQTWAALNGRTAPVGKLPVEEVLGPTGTGHTTASEFGAGAAAAPVALADGRAQATTAAAPLTRQQLQLQQSVDRLPNELRGIVRDTSSGLSIEDQAAVNGAALGVAKAYRGKPLDAAQFSADLTVALTDHLAASNPLPSTELFNKTVALHASAVKGGKLSDEQRQRIGANSLTIGQKIQAFATATDGNDYAAFLKANGADTQPQVKAELAAFEQAKNGNLRLKPETTDWLSRTVGAELRTLSNDERAIVLAKAAELEKEVSPTERARFAANMALEMGRFAAGRFPMSRGLEGVVNTFRTEGASVLDGNAERRAEFDRDWASRVLR